MKLKPEDAELFYDLFFPLLDYVNENFHITTEKVRFTGESVDPQDAYEVANFLWKRTGIIDDYSNKMNLPDEHREIIQGWKHCIPGTTFEERLYFHLSKYGGRLFGERNYRWCRKGVEIRGRT